MTIKRFALIGSAIILMAGSLAGCNSTTGTVPSSTVSQIQQATLVACGFVPTAVTIAGVLTANPIIGEAETIANAICKAVQAQAPVAAAKKLGAASPVHVTVSLGNGATAKITGYFVK